MNCNLRNFGNLTLCALVLGILMLSGLAAAEPWGNDPSHNMVLDAKNLPIEFSEENLIWEVKTGTRHQFPMPTIVGDKALVGSDSGFQPEGPWRKAKNHGGAFTCYDMKDGSLVWRLLVQQPGYGMGTYGMCGTPVVDGDRVYLQIMEEIVCLDLNGLTNGNDGVQIELELMTRKPFEPAEGESVPTELPEWSADIIWHFSQSQYDISVQDATCTSIIDVDGMLWVSTANEIGNRSRKYNAAANKPHILVLDKETGELIARDNMDVPIVFHGSWSSPSLVTVKGEKTVVYPDGYGVIHAFKIPKRSEDGSVVMLEEYWTFDMNLPENRYLPDGREIIYTLDKRLAYKYPEDYYTDNDKYYMFNDKESLDSGKQRHGFSRSATLLANGQHESIQGPDEVISMPAVAGNRIYIGQGRDSYYGLTMGEGRFVCLEVDDVATTPTVLWEDTDINRTQSTASIKDGLVYITDAKGILNCYKADTGEVVYRHDLEDKKFKERSQMVVDGKIYVCTHKFMTVLKAGPEPELLAKSRLREEVATVEAVDGKVLLVGPREVKLYGQKKANDEISARE